MILIRMESFVLATQHPEGHVILSFHGLKNVFVIRGVPNIRLIQPDTTGYPDIRLLQWVSGWKSTIQ